MITIKARVGTALGWGRKEQWSRRDRGTLWVLVVFYFMP